MNKFQKAVQKRNAELEKTNEEKTDVKEKKDFVQKSLQNEVENKSKIQKTDSIQDNEQDSVSINVNNLFIPKEKRLKIKHFI